MTERLSTSFMKLSASALGLPLEEDEHESVPSMEPPAVAEMSPPRSPTDKLRAAVNASRFVSGLTSSLSSQSSFKGEIAVLLEQHADAVQQMADTLASEDTLVSRHSGQLFKSSEISGLKTQLFKSSEISGLKTSEVFFKTSELFKPKVHDKLWRLRFLLSAKGNAASATQAAASCLKWRADNNIDAISSALPKMPFEQWPGSKQVRLVPRAADPHDSRA